MDTATRLLQLLSLLNARPVWAGGELARRLEVTPRTIRRDVARLRSLDYPVEAVSGPQGGYRLGRGSELPPLVLDDQEALAVALGLRIAVVDAAANGLEDAAVSALAKLERVLPHRLAEQLRDVQEATVALGGNQRTPVDADHLLTLAQACRRRERVRFLYEDAAGNKTLRLADPHRLVHVVGRWYLVAFCLDRADWRTFRVDRLGAPIATGAVCDEREAPDAAELVRSGMAVRAYPIKALVRLSLPLDEARQHFPSTVGLMEAEGPDTTLLRIGGYDAAGMACWLASLPCRIEVIEPDEVGVALRAHVATLLGEAVTPV